MNIGQNFYQFGRGINFNPDGSIPDYSGMMFLWGDSSEEKNYKTFFHNSGMTYLSLGSTSHQFSSGEVFYSEGGFFSSGLISVSGKVISEDLNSGDYINGDVALSQVSLSGNNGIFSPSNPNNKVIGGIHDEEGVRIQKSDSIGGGSSIWAHHLSIGGVSKSCSGFEHRNLIVNNVNSEVPLFTSRTGDGHETGSISINREAPLLNSSESCNLYVDGSLLCNLPEFIGRDSMNFDSKICIGSGRPDSGDNSSRVFLLYGEGLVL